MTEVRRDQAEGLRKLFARDAVRSISFNGGRGGSGKTSVVSNLGYALARQGRRVLILDEFTGLGNVSSRLGLYPAYQLDDVVRRRVPLDEVLLHGPGGLTVLPMSSDLRSLARLDDLGQQQLTQAFAQLAADVDVILVDAVAATGLAVPTLSLATEETVMVVSPRPESITDAYAMIKRLALDYARREFRILVTRVADFAAANELFNHLAAVADQYFDVSLRLVGFVPEDPLLHRANRLLQPVHQAFPEANSSAAFAELADVIDRWPGRGGMRHPEGFMQRVIEGSRALAELGQSGSVR